MERLNNFTLDCITQIYSTPDMPHTTHNDVYAALQELKEYRSICPTPEKLKEIDKMYLEKCEEVNRLKATINNAIEQMEKEKYSEYDATADFELYQVNYRIDACIDIMKEGGVDEN